MTHWVNRLDVKDIWQAAKTDGDAPKLARGMAERIKAHRLYKTDEQLQFICRNFERMATNPDTDFDDTDLAYEALCRWGDEAEFDVLKVGWGKRCWIATF